MQTQCYRPQSLSCSSCSGETDGNRQKVLQGHVDTPLNDLGRDQARRAGVSLAEERFVAVYTSDLCRAVQTAEAILGQNKSWTRAEDEAWKKLVHCALCVL
jgi:broad specificity phosphatase PhoE